MESELYARNALSSSSRVEMNFLMRAADSLLFDSYDEASSSHLAFASLMALLMGVSVLLG